MKIAIVAEFRNFKNEFQWNILWTKERQEKYGCAIQTVIINPSVLSEYSKESPYWDWLKEADLIFTYCTRMEVPEEAEYKDIYGRPYRWVWWVLPKYVKLFAKPTAKIITQWDDDWVWLFHPDWVWWHDRPSDRGGPKELFLDSKIFDYTDLVWTVLEKPEFAKFCSKPIEYMPLPYLIGHYLDALAIVEREKKKFGVLELHKEHNLILLRHTSAVASVEQIISEVAEKMNMPVSYFSTSWGNPDLSKQEAIQKHNVPFVTHLHFEPPQFMTILMYEGYVAIDDSDYYMGWSRFGMECAMMYTPCIGSTHSVKLFFPELYTEHNDFAKQRELVKRLVEDKEFYERIALEGHKRCLEHFDPDRLCKAFLESGRRIGAKETPFDKSQLEDRNFHVPFW